MATTSQACLNQLRHHRLVAIYSVNYNNHWKHHIFLMHHDIPPYTYMVPPDNCLEMDLLVLVTIQVGVDCLEILICEDTASSMTCFAR